MSGNEPLRRDGGRSERERDHDELERPRKLLANGQPAGSVEDGQR
jgi:hypothetical protein